MAATPPKKTKSLPDLQIYRVEHAKVAAFEISGSIGGYAMSNASNMNSHCDPVISNLRVAGSIPAAPTRFKGLQPNLASNIGVAREFSAEKLPVTPKFNYQLRAQIRYILANLDSVKPSRVRGKVQDRLRDLARELRNSKGFSKWWPLSFGAACLGAFALLAYSHQPKIYVYQYPADTLQILRKVDPFHYRMRQFHSEPGNSFTRVFSTAFCSNYAPMFSEGETLTWMAYEDRGKCWSVSSKALGYTFLRDDEGNVKLAPNCYWITDVAATCKGEPQWPASRNQ